MSGIAVVHDRVGPHADPVLLDRLVAQLAWRGPDRTGTWLDGSVGLGATQFCTTPEDQGSQQPVVGRDREMALVFEGRVDNREELLAQLARPVGAQRVPSDAELVLAAYARWGESFPARLVGPFAVAVWDRRLQRLVCARDPVGQRPFFYRVTGRDVQAASTITALLRACGLDHGLNDDYIWDFLGTAGMVGSLVPDETPFTGIRRLPPGHILVVTPTGVRVTRYWEPWNLPPLQYRDEREYVEHFRQLFTQVVRAHSRASGPVCATLSGGLDSSAIVCMRRQLEAAGEVAGEPARTLTLVWPESSGPREGYDERQFVESVLARYPGPGHYLPGERLHDVDLFGDATPALDEPCTLFGQQIWSMLAGQTRELGSRVLLSGSGGDHLLTGNRFYLTDLLVRGELRELGRWLRRESRWQGLPYPVLVAGYLLAPHLPRHRGARLLAALAKEMDRQRVDSLYYWQVPEWIREPARQRRRGLQRHKLLRRRFSSFAAQKDFELLEVGSQDHVRLALYDLALASGVDLRNPFFDTRLVDFCLRLPPDLKYRSGATKVVLRLALRDVLPTDVARRAGKTAYNFALTEQVRRNWAAVHEIFRDPETQRRGYVDAAVLLTVLAQCRQGGSGVMDLRSLAAALGLEDWLRRSAGPTRSRSSTAARERARETEVMTMQAHERR